MNLNQPSADQPPLKSLEMALKKNAGARDAVQEVADELSVVHAVLTQEVAKIDGDGDAASAVERTAALEKKLTETTKRMDEVNLALAEQQASLEHLNQAR